MEGGSIQTDQKEGVQYESEAESSTIERLLTERQSKRMNLSPLLRQTTPKRSKAYAQKKKEKHKKSKNKPVRRGWRRVIV